MWDFKAASSAGLFKAAASPLVVNVSADIHAALYRF